MNRMGHTNISSTGTGMTDDEVIDEGNLSVGVLLENTESNNSKKTRRAKQF